MNRTKAIVALLLCLIVSYVAVTQSAVKMMSLENQPIVKGKLNGKTVYFRVDSGSDVLIFNLRDVKRYKINYGRMVSSRYKFSGLNSEHNGELLVTNGADMYLDENKMEGQYWQTPASCK